MREYVPDLVLQDVCCQGWGWRVLIKIVSVWGMCENPDCPKDKGGRHEGLDHYMVEDLEEFAEVQNV